MKRVMKKWAAIVLAVAFLFCLSACNEAPQDGNESKDSIVFGVVREPSGLDPHRLAETVGFIVTCAVYDNLVKMDEEGNYVPWLADSVTASEDGLAYTIKYTKDIQFSNGDPLTIEDIVFSIQRTIDIGWGFDMTRFIEKVELVDDETATITLNAPFNGFMGSLASPYFAIMSKKYIESIGDDAIYREPMGTGPYTVENWMSGDHIELKANENYFAGAPNIKEITYKFISDKSTALMALESGELDIYDDIAPTDIQTVENNEDLQFYTSEKAAVFTMCINTEVAPLDDIRVRQALAYAINREDIVTGVFEGYAETVNSFIPRNCAGYSDNVEQYPFNAEKAEELLAEAGYAEGLALKMTIQDSNRGMAQVIQSNLKEVGIELEVEVLENSAFSTQVYSQGDYELTLRPWIGMFPDAYSVLYSSYHEDCYGSSGNIAHLRDAVLNDLLDTAATATEEEKVAMYDKVVQHLKDNAYEVPLVTNRSYVAANAKLQGIYVPPTGIYDLTKLHY